MPSNKSLSVTQPLFLVYGLFLPINGLHVGTERLKNTQAYKHTYIAAIFNHTYKLKLRTALPLTTTGA